MIVDCRRADDDDEREDDAKLTEPQEQLGKHVRARGPAEHVLALLGQRRHAASSTSPVAACMIASSVASARGNSRITRPSKSTTILSAIPSTSGSSDEIIRTATP